VEVLPFAVEGLYPDQGHCRCTVYFESIFLQLPLYERLSSFLSVIDAKRFKSFNLWNTDNSTCINAKLASFMHRRGFIIRLKKLQPGAPDFEVPKFQEKGKFPAFL